MQKCSCNISNDQVNRNRSVYPRTDLNLLNYTESPVGVFIGSVIEDLESNKSTTQLCPRGVIDSDGNLKITSVDLCKKR